MHPVFATLTAVVLTLAFAATALADVPPTPPPAIPGSKSPPGLQPTLIIIVGIGTALVFVLAGFGVARYQSHSTARMVGIVGSIAVLGIAGFIAIRTTRALEEYATLKAVDQAQKAEYQKSLANWRRDGPPRPPRVFRDLPFVVTIIALALPAGSPHNLPWAAVFLNSTPISRDTYFAD